MGSWLVTWQILLKMGQEDWIRKLRAYERLRNTAKRPDRVQVCIDVLMREGKERGWI